VSVPLPPEAVAAAVDSARCPVVLAPTRSEGWFDGRALACWDPVERLDSVPLPVVAERLDATFRGAGPPVSVAVLEYEGTASLRSYAGFVSWSNTSTKRRPWHPTGDIDLSVLASFTPSAASRPAPLLLDPIPDMDGDRYRAAVEEIRAAIREGAVYLVNLTYRLTGQPAVLPGEAFRILLAESGGMMSAYAHDGARALASVSPERFARLTRHEDGDHAEIWPIKGTRPRGKDAAEDRGLAEELLASEKERAELVMVVDLERNDLGRVSRPGSVTVDPIAGVMATPYCHQMYASVRGTIHSDSPVIDLLGAAFPCGSVTGTPKIAAMDVIAQLENSPRGPYTGALVVAVPGGMDSSVLIRTLVHDDSQARWGTGGGITIDSDPGSEWEESVLKAQPAVGADVSARAVRNGEWRA
jgi:anthranilate/para-aminobenzoate synthase component I